MATLPFVDNVDRELLSEQRVILGGLSLDDPGLTEGQLNAVTGVWELLHSIEDAWEKEDNAKKEQENKPEDTSCKCGGDITDWEHTDMMWGCPGWCEECETPMQRIRPGKVEQMCDCGRD